MQNTHVERISEDGLTRLAWGWRFADREYRLELDEFYEQTRPTKRHKFATVRVYQRLGHNYRGDSRRIDKDGVPFTADVVAEARATFLANVIAYVDGEPPKE